MHIHILLFVLAFSGFFSGCQINGFAQKLSPPFSIDKRPPPRGSDPEILIPQTVGPFKRSVISGNPDPFSGEDINVEYKSGNETIFFGFGITQTEKDAREAVKITRREAIESKINIEGEQYSTGKDPAYFKIADFMSWSRGKYFFYAKAGNPQSLEKFMKSFPH